MSAGGRDERPDQLVRAEELFYVLAGSGTVMLGRRVGRVVGSGGLGRLVLWAVGQVHDAVVVGLIGRASDRHVAQIVSCTRFPRPPNSQAATPDRHRGPPSPRGRLIEQPARSHQKTSCRLAVRGASQRRPLSLDALRLV